MTEKSKSDAATVALELATTGFRKRMHFNRFAIIPDGDFRVLHFAYYPSSNWLMDHFVCIVHCQAVEALRKENTDYLGKLGILSVPGPPEWEPPATTANAELISYFGLARRSSEAEISMYNFSTRMVLDLARQASGSALPTEAIALLRSDLEIHKHFIAHLYL